jgi:hypothetical protein
MGVEAGPRRRYEPFREFGGISRENPYEKKRGKRFPPAPPRFFGSRSAGWGELVGGYRKSFKNRSCPDTMMAVRLVGARRSVAGELFAGGGDSRQS